MGYPEHGLTADILARYVEDLDPQAPNIEVAIDAAVQSFRDMAHWHVFPEVTETMTLDGEGGRVLTLPTLKVAEIISVTENGNVLDPNAYEWSETGDLKRLGRPWTTRWRGLEVTLRHGYTAAEIPPSLILAIASAVHMQAMSPMGIPEVIGPFQLTGAGGAWVGDSAKTIARYVLPWSA